MNSSILLTEIPLFILTAIIQVDMGKPVPERLYSGFHWS